ncbi:hypothetical protein LTR53_017189 [Teratosphaeriaceae sp. CCFEE 6253]|nr:hypothetical protein LTR53_017189 [Teratosphaeriaceae sp. CCFEE 6253]
MARWLRALFGSVAVANAAMVPRETILRGSAQDFGYTNSSFIHKGREIQLLGGQMDPQRVPAEYWRDRLEKAKAMGLNTVFSYIYWNELEPSPGVWDWHGIHGMNDIAKFYQTVADAGMLAVLRPGPYVCGERDWGGFPGWLSEVQNLTVRTTNPQFLELSDHYLGNLSQQISKYQVTEGGPIVLAQVENEYGNYAAGDAANHDYTKALSDIISQHFSVLQYTNDAGSKAALDGGHVPGALAEVDGDPYFGFCNFKWLTTWGPDSLFPVDSGIAYGDQEIVNGITYMLGQGGSFSLYMFHGGTNFAFGNGPLDFGQYYPVTTSYDYGAPLNESGRRTDLYDSIAAAITNYTGVQPPAFPATPTMMTTDAIPLKPVSRLLDELPDQTLHGSPVNMEALGQYRGFTLYRYVAPSGTRMAGQLHVGDGPRDRVLVYINGTQQGVLDDLYKSSQQQNVTLNVTSGDTVDLLVENQGRVDYYFPILDQRKGIVGRVYIGAAVVAPWSMYSYPVASPPSTLSLSSGSSYPGTPSSALVTTNSTPVWFTGSFKVPGDKCGSAAADTYLTIEGGVKGVLYVNGVKLGRYWTVGPQQSLYVPGVWLKEDDEIAVLELEPQPDMKLTARGSGERRWFNRPDPDCWDCTSVNPNPDYHAQ